MPFNWNDLSYGFGLPTLSALLLLMNMRWMFPVNFARRYAPSVAFVAAFQVGYWLLKLGPVYPEGHWQWLPHLLVVAAIIGVVSASQDLNVIDRVLLATVATIISAILLVPNWQDLTFPRQEYMLGWSLLVIILAQFYNSISLKFPATIFPAVLCLTCLTGAVLMTHSGSLLFGQIGLASAGGTLGLTVAAIFDKRSRSMDGLAYPMTFFLCTTMLIAEVNSFTEIPFASYLLIPCAPLGLWLASVGPLSRFKGTSGSAIQFGIPLLICSISLGLAVWYEPLFSQAEH